MILSIHQPSYFPWLGLLDKIARSDVFVVMDEVQLSDSAFQHRNLFLAMNGEAKYLSIPFVHKGYRERPLRDLEISDASWHARHRDFLWSNYRRHAFAPVVMPLLEPFFSAHHAKLFDVIMASMRWCFDVLNIPVRVVFQSELVYDHSLRRGDLVLALARAAGASCYLSGTGAQAYLDESAFGSDLTLRYNRFIHPTYPQKNAQTFVAGLSCLDLLFNVGPDAARSYLLMETGA